MKALLKFSYSIPCPLGQPIILTVAHVPLLSFNCKNRIFVCRFPTIVTMVFRAISELHDRNLQDVCVW